MDAVREIACSVILGPLWGVDMTLPHLDFIGATDASGEFGLGGCTASVPRSVLSKFAKAAERDGDRRREAARAVPGQRPHHGLELVPRELRGARRREHGVDGGARRRLDGGDEARAACVDIDR